MNPLGTLSLVKNACYVGIAPAPEEFQRRMDEALEGLKEQKQFTMIYLFMAVAAMTKRPLETIIRS